MTTDVPHPAFFGYGSLVNLATHGYEDPFPARLTGWRRVWKHSSRRPVAFLSVEPAEGAEIQGMLAHVPGGDWAALDQREQAYLRRDVTDHVTHDRPRRQTAVYEAARGHIAPPSTEHPILLSYLDVVVQGYLNLHGEDGVAHFFATTGGFEGPILDDRKAPIYPRHQTLSGKERRTVDTALEDIGARIIQAETARPSASPASGASRRPFPGRDPCP